MTNNDVLRRVRYIFDFNDAKMISIFALADEKVTREQVSSWLKKEEEPDYQQLSDMQMAIFLNGLINDKRGKKDGAQPTPENKLNNNIIFRKLKIALNLKEDETLALLKHEPEKRLTNNIIFMKLKIALNLKAEDVLDTMSRAEFRMSKHELSALFRKPDHKHYRECKDQILRNFLKGLQLNYRNEDKTKSDFKWK